jgi:uncharacterized protein YutE (UPF0331/DUF86 family)
MIAPQTAEYSLLESVLANYKAEGYEVFVNPSDAILPPLEKNYRPDAVAIRPDKKIAIEVVRSGREITDRMYHLRGRFSQDNWELIVLYMSPGASVEQIDVAPRKAIDRATQAVIELRDAGQQTAALMVGWSALEAIARALLPDRLARPQPAAKLIEVLASEGYLTPSEADTLRTLATVRNAAAHGRLDAAVEPKELNALVSALGTLAEFVPKND